MQKSGRCQPAIEFSAETIDIVSASDSEDEETDERKVQLLMCRILAPSKPLNLVEEAMLYAPIFSV
jgi:hypothetical protein